MKNEILDMLKENRDSYVSGQYLSDKLGITRAAIWKNINQLKNQGYVIESMSKNGYKLIDCPDILTDEELKDYLNTKLFGKKIIHFDSIDSTNNKAKEFADNGESEGIIIVAEEQTLGRGRLGKKWHSSKGKGIWMSVILKPEIDISYLSLITQIACIAVGKVLSEINEDIRIKWPNDVLIHGKKVCGILTEMSGELNELNYIIIGIGMNINQNIDDFPEELSLKATSMLIETGKIYSRKELMSKTLTEFENLYNDFLLYASSKNLEDFLKDMEEYLMKFDLNNKISYLQVESEIVNKNPVEGEGNIMNILHKYNFNISKNHFDKVKREYISRNFQNLNTSLTEYVKSLFIEMAEYIKEKESNNANILNINPEDVSGAMQIINKCSKPIIEAGFIQEFWKGINSSAKLTIDEELYRFQLILLVTGNILNKFDS